MVALIGKTVLITGASSGIGSALARAYARRGAHVVLTARRQDRLDALAEEIASYNRKVLVFTADVTVDGDLDRAVAETLKVLPSIDYVFANAGFGVAGQAETLRLADYGRQFETNVFGVLRTFYATLESLKASRGHFVVIGSANGYLSLPGNSAYGMSKHAVRALSDSLFYELKPYGIRVTHVSPGFVNTEIRRVNNAGEFLLNAKDPIPKWLMASPESAVRTIMRHVDRGARECAVTFHGWFVIRLARHFPLLTQKLIEWLGVTSRRQPS